MVARSERPLVIDVIRHYGSWDAALRAVGTTDGRDSGPLIPASDADASAPRAAPGFLALMPPGEFSCSA